MDSGDDETLSDLIAEYSDPNDKIILLTRAIDMILANLGAVEVNLTNLHNAVTQNSNYLSSLADAIMKMNTEIKRISNKMGDVESAIQDKIEEGLNKLKSEYRPVAAKVSSYSTPSVPDDYTPGPPKTAHSTSIEEPSLLKPSQMRGGGAPAGGAGMPMGGISPRMAMMAEIKRKMGGGAVAGPTGGGGDLGGGYIPKIQQPRKAKPIPKNLTKTMNKLLETKFQKQLGGSVPPAAKGGPPRGPPSAVPRAPPRASSKSHEKEKKQKKKEKKKDKSKSSTSPQLQALEDKIKSKFG